MPRQRGAIQVDTSPVRRILNQLGAIDEALHKQEQRIMGRAAAAIEPMVRQMLIGNASRVLNLNHEQKGGDTTVPLRDMINATKVMWQQKSRSLQITMATRRAGFSTKDYAKIGALNYGALRGAQTLNEKHRNRTARKRQKIKEALQASGRRSGTMTATVAKNFYQLNAAQLGVVAAAFEAAMSREAQRVAGEAAAKGAA